MKTLPAFILTLALASLLAAAEQARWSEPFDLKSPDGRLFRGCTVRQLTPESVMLVHADGLANLPLEKLDAEWQERFGYDPEKAKLWKEEQLTAQKNAALERDRQKAEKKAEKAADQSDKIASLEKQLKEKSEEIDRLKQTLGTLQQQVDAQAAALNGRPAQQNVTVVERVGVVPYQVPVVVPQTVVRTVPVPYPVPVRAPTPPIKQPVLIGPGTRAVPPVLRPPLVFERK